MSYGDSDYKKRYFNPILTEDNTYYTHYSDHILYRYLFTTYLHSINHIISNLTFLGLEFEHENDV